MIPHLLLETQHPAVNITSNGNQLPRFASLKAHRVNVRVGPDKNKYNILWSYTKEGLPVEIIQEYDNWRRIRDSDGDSGWIHNALLSKQRTVIITPWQKDKSGLSPMRKEPSDQAKIVAHIESGVIGKIRQCTGIWCQIEIEKRHGWLKQIQLWGVSPGEKIF
jgi:SH3-like domain-containing protein